MPVKRTGDKPKKPPNGREMPHKGPLSAEEAFIAPKFSMSDANLVAKPPYLCTCCHRSYDQQKGKFYQTKSKLYAGNNQYVTLCINCLQDYYVASVVQLRDEHQALLHMAQMLDWYVSDEMIDDILANQEIKSPLRELAKRVNRVDAKDGTYLDALIDGVVAIAPEAISEEDPAEQKAEIDPRAVELFGLGYSVDEYAILTQHYDMLTKQFVNADSVQDSLIKDLCTTKLMQMQQRNDPDSYVKLTRSYQETLKNSGLKTRSTDEYADDESATWGQFIAQVEKYSPAEIYEQDELYRDIDGIGDYIQRFFTRPTLNYFGKTNDKDPEFSLTDEEVNGE